MVPSSNCTGMEISHIRLLALLRGGTAAVGFLVLVIIVSLVVCKRGLAGMTGSTQTRLMSYLLLSTAAYLLALSSQTEHYWNYQEYNISINWKKDLCEAVGMADEYMATVHLIFIVGIALHFIYHSLNFYATKKKSINLHLGLTKKQKRGLEILLIVVSLVLPALYIWVPFILVPYGETGAWCWIKTLDKYCHAIRGSFWEQMGMWYIPFGIAASFSLCAIIFFLVSLKRYFPTIKTRKRQKKGESVVLIVFLATYCLLFLVEFVSHFVSVRMKVNLNDDTRREYFAMWLLYSLSPPLCGLSLPIGLLLYTFTGTLREAVNQYCTCNCIRQKTAFISLFRNTSSFTRLPSYKHSSDSV